MRASAPAGRCYIEGLEFKDGQELIIVFSGGVYYTHLGTKYYLFGSSNITQMYIHSLQMRNSMVSKTHSKQND